MTTRCAIKILAIRHEAKQATTPTPLTKMFSTLISTMKPNVTATRPSGLYSSILNKKSVTAFSPAVNVRAPIPAIPPFPPHPPNPLHNSPFHFLSPLSVRIKSLLSPGNRGLSISPTFSRVLSQEASAVPSPTARCAQSTWSRRVSSSTQSSVGTPRRNLWVTHSLYLPLLYSLLFLSILLSPRYLVSIFFFFAFTLSFSFSA